MQLHFSLSQIKLVLNEKCSSLFLSLSNNDKFQFPIALQIFHYTENIEGKRGLGMAKIR